mmetsp:Transcript_8117/g.17629  ORF Transcript_8117/g.17629 Transcript_8117/m.17629 type:complete len:302 (-) Transcript_8117:160-1065(-)
MISPNMKYRQFTTTALLFFFLNLSSVYSQCQELPGRYLLDPNITTTLETKVKKSKTAKGKAAKAGKDKSIGKLVKTKKDKSKSKETCTNMDCVGDSNDRCEAPSTGTCSIAAQTFLSGDLQLAISKLNYGKYCGRFNRCSLYDQECYEGCEEGTLPLPCADGGIDEACMVHDHCLDEFINGGVEVDTNIDPLDRLTCDSALASTLNDLFEQAVIDGNGVPQPTGLCDADFYASPVDMLGGMTLIRLVSHEAILLVAPFCCTTILPLCPSVGGENCEKATQLCNIFIAGMQAAFGEGNFECP